jgi:hypothetical protein
MKRNINKQSLLHPEFLNTKSSNKYLYIYVLVFTISILLFSTLSFYTINLLNPSLILTLLIILFFSFLAAILLTLGLSIFDPIIIELANISIRLHRFENLSNPLLLHLSNEAAGTYHHSINVSNLSQKAAKKIGVNSLLVRTAAYYHDIGKIINPNCYIENQSPKEIPTDSDPRKIKENAQKIISHVSEGIKIARKNNLPEDIIDLISQHHGTSKTLYFYEKAREHGLSIKKTDFRYLGPKPLSKEAAILMLADAVEATVRTMGKISIDGIKTIINEVTNEKLTDNQLKNSCLSEKDLLKIKESFESVLLSIYHPRIKYPVTKKISRLI